MNKMNRVTLADLPTGTLLISGNGSKGLYSNGSAPIFVMKLGEEKAKILWQGTNQYHTFMKSLVAKQQKGKLKENVDYILPKNVGIVLPTKETSVLKDTDFNNVISIGSYMPSYSKFHVNLSTLIKNSEYKNSYLNVLSNEKNNFAFDWTIFANSVLTKNNVVFVADLNDVHGLYKVTFTKDEYENIKNQANNSLHRNRLPMLPDFDPDNPVFEFVEDTSEGTKEKDFGKMFGKSYQNLSEYLGEQHPDTDSTTDKDEPMFKVKLSGSTPEYENVYLNFCSDDADWDYSTNIFDGYIYPADGNEWGIAKTTFTLTEYNKIREQLKKQGEDNDFTKEFGTLPEFSRDNSQFEMVHDPDEDTEAEPKANTNDYVKDGTNPKFKVQLLDNNDPFSYLNYKPESISEVSDEGNELTIPRKGTLFMGDGIEGNEDYQVRFTLEEYEKLRELALNCDEYRKLNWKLPKYDPDNPQFILVSGDQLPEKNLYSMENLPRKVLNYVYWIEMYVSELPDALHELSTKVNSLRSYMGRQTYGLTLYEKVGVLKDMVDKKVGNPDTLDYSDIGKQVDDIIDYIQLNGNNY